MIKNEQEKYIQDQINNDYVIKSKNTAIAYLISAVFFAFLHRSEPSYRIYIDTLLTGIWFLALMRLYNANLYSKLRITVTQAVKVADASALFNGFLWSAVGFFSVLSFEEINVQIIITFITLITYSAGSTVTLSHKKPILITFNILMILPQIFYAIVEYYRSGESAVFWLFAYIAVSLFYTTRQAAVVQEELRKRFLAEFELKKSLQAIAASKKTLEEEESIKTFHASRLSSLGEMAGGVAHEINNPLTIIQGMTKSLLIHDEFNIDEKTKSKLSKINSATERIAKIVKGMKTIASKNDHVEHEAVRTSKVLELSLSLFEERFKNENITFVLDNPNDPQILCNSLQISQVIMNILSNAMDVLSKEKSDPYLKIKVSENIQRKAVDIRIINSGPLIPADISDKIFEPFFSTKSMEKGTGLGLSISQTLANGNGGSLSYEVYEGKVCFRLHLPIVISNT